MKTNRAFARVRTRLLAAFLILLVAALSLATVGWVGMRGAQQAVAGFEGELLPNIADALELAERTTQLAAVAPKLGESRSWSEFNEDAAAVEELLQQIGRHAGSLPPAGELSGLLAGLHAEVERDLKQLLALTRLKLELQQGFEAQLTRLDRAGNELNAPGQRGASPDPALVVVWSSLVQGASADAAATLGRLEADVEVSMLAARRRGALARYSADTRQTLEELASNSEGLLSRRRKLLELERRNAYLVVLTRANATELSDSVSRYVGGLRDAAAERSEAVRRAVRFGETGMLVLQLACLGIAMLATRYVRRLVAGIEKITEVMSRLAQGDTAQPTPATSRRDELGALARTFEVFREALVAKQHLVNDLRTQKEMIAAVHDSMTDALAVFDAGGRLLLWNPQLGHLLARHGITPYPGLRATELLERLPPGTRWTAPGRTESRPLAEARRIHFRAFDHVELHLPGGVVLDTRTRAMPGTGAVTLITDLSARRAIDQQLQHAQKLEVLGQLTGGVAHDFNNYLGTILGTLPLLQPDLRQDPVTLARLARVQRVATSAAALTRRLLAFARRQPLQAETVLLDEMVEEMRDLIEYSAGTQVEVELRLQAPGARLHIDRGQLENALLNLVLNSAAAMPEGGRLTVSTGVAGSAARLEVADTGSGIPEAAVGKVFEPFFTTKPAGEGSGLGLSIVYGFVKQSGGEIELSSRAGEGTCIVLSLPLCREGPCVLPGAPGSAPASLAALAGRRVLVVDDDAAFGATVQDLLAQAGAEVRLLASAEAALATLQLEPVPELVLSDVCLGPGWDGPRLRQAVQARRPGLPVVLMSGLSAEMLQERPGWLPGQPFLHKPFDAAALAACLQEQLRTAETAGATA
ncbi:ATP-binding protein [Aquabacterium sp. A7-Y]|uniref:ATP-binding protein n=1 Tax=Aquabacterium sp. A7-Y TaxID=1349605 RepID=UPI00223DB73A|nr:ATP-binding protein [Aquabacterium sp. A7-Y]MCW7540592.1 ATP-binding protein [Aquabacterium sp. A7-Y]